jgi:hypothetical protein
MEGSEMANSIIDICHPFAASELVLLKADQFASRAKLGGIKLFGSEVKYAARNLSHMMCLVGFLAAHKAGTLLLEQREKKAFLRKTTALFGEPAGSGSSWPSPSLEADLIELATQRKSKGKSSEVSDLLYAWLERDTVNPWESAIRLVMERMAARGLLETEKMKKLKVFTVIQYNLPQSTASQAAQKPTDPITSILASFSESNTEAWKSLEKQIEKGFKSRVEQQDTWD